MKYKAVVVNGLHAELIESRIPVVNMFGAQLLLDV